MPITVQELRTEVEADTATAKRQLQDYDRIVGDAAARTESLSSRAKGAFGTVTKAAVGLGAVGGAALVGLGAKAINVASDAQETASLIQNSLGPAASEFNRRIDEIADTANRSSVELREGSSTIIAMVRNMGMGQEQAGAFAASMARIAPDLGSFFNVADNQVFQDLQAALAGSSETLQKYGIDVRETTLKQQALDQGLIESASDALPRNVRAQLLLQSVVSQAGDALGTMGMEVGSYQDALEALGGATGDAKRTSDSWQNTMRGIKATIKDTTAEIGQTLIPIFDPLLQQIAQVIDDVGPQLADWLAVALPAAIQTASDFWTNTLQPAIQTVIDVWNNTLQPALETITNLFTSSHGEMESITGSTWSTIADLVEQYIGAVSDVISDILAFVNEFWTENHEDIQAFTDETWGAISGIIDTALQVIQTAFNLVLPIITEFWETHHDTIMTVAETIWNQIKINIETILGVIQGVLNTALALLQGDWETAWEEIKGIAETIWNGIKVSIENIWPLIESIFSTGLDTIKGFFDDAIEDLKGAGTDIIEGLKEGINDKWGEFIEFFKDKVRSIPVIGKRLLGEESPSTEAIEMMDNFMLGLIIGIQQGEPAVLAAIAETTESMIKEFQDIFDTFGPDVMVKLEQSAGIASSVAQAFNDLIASMLNISDVGEIHLATNVLTSIRMSAEAMIDQLRGLADEMRKGGTAEDIRRAAATAAEVASAFADVAGTFGDIMAVAEELEGGLFPQVDIETAFIGLSSLVQGVVQRFQEIASEINAFLLPATSAAASLASEAAGALADTAEGFLTIMEVAEEFGGMFPMADVETAFIGLQSIIRGMIQRFVELADEFGEMDPAVQAMIESWTDLIGAVSGMLDSLQSLIDAADWDIALDDLRSKVQAGWEKIAVGFQAIMDIMPIPETEAEIQRLKDNTLDPALQAMIESWSGLMGAVTGMIDSLQALVDIADWEIGLETLRTKVQAGWELIAFGFQAIMDIMPIPDTADDIQRIKDNTIDPALQKMLESWGGTISSVTGMIDGLMQLVDLAGWEGTIDEFVQAINDGMDFVLAGIQEAAGLLRDHLDALARNDALFDFSEEEQSLLDSWSASLGSVMGMIDGLLKLIDLADWKGSIDEFVQAINDGMDFIIAGMNEAVNQIQAFFSTWSQENIAGDTIGQGILDLLSSWEAALSPIGSAVDAITSILEGNLAGLDVGAFGSIIRNRLMPAMRQMAFAIRDIVAEIGPEVIEVLGQAGEDLQPVADAVSGVVGAIQNVFALGELGDMQVQIAPGGFHNQGVWRTVATFADNFERGLQRTREGLRRIASEFTAMAGDPIVTTAISAATGIESGLESLLSAVESIISLVGRLGEFGTTGMDNPLFGFADGVNALAQSIINLNGALGNMQLADAGIGTGSVNVSIMMPVTVEAGAELPRIIKDAVEREVNDQLMQALKDQGVGE